MMTGSFERAPNRLRATFHTTRDAGDDNQAERAASAVIVGELPARHVRGNLASSRTPALSPELLRSAIHYIDDNLDSKLKWEQIASAIGMDAFKFGRGFKLATGVTPHQYVIRHRVRRAMKLLAAGKLSIAEIAVEVGCSCQSHLTIVFRKYAGTTPGVFRRAVSATQRVIDAAASRHPAPRLSPDTLAGASGRIHA